MDNASNWGKNRALAEILLVLRSLSDRAGPPAACGGRQSKSRQEYGTSQRKKPRASGKVKGRSEIVVQLTEEGRGGQEMPVRFDTQRSKTAPVTGEPET